MTEGDLFILGVIIGGLIGCVGTCWYDFRVIRRLKGEIVMLKHVYKPSKNQYWKKGK